jgi:2,3-bisphosphoglycerate-independent phosphoglycerate mutase
MLGHSGNLDKTVECLKKIDESLEELFEAADDNFYKIILTSDHGNVDEMLDAEGNPVKSHSMNPVPFVIRDKKVNLRHRGDLTNIAPTILKYMDIAIPEEMKDTRVLLLDEE